MQSIEEMADATMAAELSRTSKSSGNSGNSGNNAATAGATAFPVDAEPTGNSGNMPRGYSLDSRGLWYRPPEEPDKEPPAPIWICSPLAVTALTRDADGEAWGRLLEFPDPDGTAHKWPCPMEMLASDGAEFRRVLMALGLEIAPGSKPRQHLATFVQTMKVKQRAVCTDKAGWYGNAFVLPDETIGEDAERVLLQVVGEPPKMRQSGTVEAWREHIGLACINNSRLLIAVSTAFAAPLLGIVGHEASGLHLVGESSTGKTTALKVAASVWGGADYLRRWRTTTNGLEAIARGHNDGLLVLDELSEIDPRQAGEAAYMLANGSGKHRARRDGLARKAATWRLLFLSSGEIGLADHMAEAGKRSRAGQEVRLVEIPVDGRYGLFDDLHGRRSGAAFAEALNQAAQTHYGAPAREYLRGLVTMPRDALGERVRDLIGDFIADALPPDAGGQAQRVCTHFGLIAAGGELATKLNLTGWPEGAATEAARVCFTAWLNCRGGAGAQEEARALAQVRHFIEAHGESRFTDLNDIKERPTINRAGFVRMVNGRKEHLIFTETFRREVCAGLNYQAVARVLKKNGLLASQVGNHLTVKVRGHGRMYAIREALDDES